ncbi:hypothetical protein WJX74_005817 [Apatococcus lobatus]|uniref:Uncharacterized protein n=1 Tax=Apatococcus lobatus TaxID=904363 RepID=A0AAW1QI19_9CHLO
METCPTMFSLDYPQGFRDWVGNRELLSSFESENGTLSAQQQTLEERAASLSKLEKALHARARELGYQEAQTLNRARQYSEVLREPQDSFKQAHKRLTDELAAQRNLNLNLTKQVRAGLQLASHGQREADRANTRGRLGLHNSLQDGQAYKQALLNGAEKAATSIFCTRSSSSQGTYRQRC